MLKYFYYIWNLLKSDEKLELFQHYGKCIMAAILFTIIDWQYLILICILSMYGYENILQIIIGIQLFTWLLSFWYYYIKYQILTKQNYFYTLISSRHYKYVLSRISKNASYRWINEKSTNELTSQLTTTDAGLRYIFTFMTSLVRLLAIMTFSILIISINYKTSAIIFILFFIALYYVILNQLQSEEYIDKKKKLQIDSRKNSLILSNNISVLLDNVLHNNEGKLIKNITTFNNISKTSQSILFSYEDQSFTKVGLIVISGYVCALMLSSYIMNLGYNDFMIFFISALLTYKCISNNLNELCDMYVNIRQTVLDFNALDDIWNATCDKRPQFKQIQLPNRNLNFKGLIDYHKFHYTKNENEQIKLYETYIKTNAKTEFYRFCNNHQANKSFYLTNEDNMKKLYNYKRFILTDKKRSIDFDKKLSEKIHDLYSDKDLYKLYKHQNIVKLDPLFTIRLYKLNFNYSYKDGEEIHGIHYSSPNPLTFNSNSHILINGPSGSGKTTLLKVFRGIIHLDNKDDIKTTIQFIDSNEKPINLSHISNSICYCSQNSISFTTGSIYQIITDDYISKHIKTSISKQEHQIILKALTTACIDPKFRNISFKCSKDNISGGQKQRLTLAKIIYRILKENKQIIVLDEIDAGLDYKTAEKILINLKILFKDRMLLVVLHSNELKSLFKNRINITDGIIK